MCDLDRFFLDIDVMVTIKEIFFKKQPLCKNIFLQAMKTFFSAEGIKKSDTKGWAAIHGLRRTMATLLFNHGHSNSSVSLRTGHRYPYLFQRYKTLRGGFEP